MNGDTSQYYIYATSLAQGEGYTELGTLGHPPTNGFPPGYPLLMAPLRALTPSIVAQKIQNGVMLFGATAVIVFLSTKSCTTAVGIDSGTYRFA